MDWGVKMKSEINESVSVNDLRGHISNLVSIDQYKSKTDNDRNVIVIAYKVKDKNPAQDLSQFIESGLDLLDVDISPGPDTDGYYTVYVEIERDSQSISKILKITEDVSRLDEEITQWMFTSYNDKMPQEFSLEAISNSIVTSSYDYEVATNPEAKAISERMKFLNKY